MAAVSAQGMLAHEKSWYCVTVHAYTPIQLSAVANLSFLADITVFALS
jgi:hypothetical protein